MFCWNTNLYYFVQRIAVAVSDSFSVAVSHHFEETDRFQLNDFVLGIFTAVEIERCVVKLYFILAPQDSTQVFKATLTLVSIFDAIVADDDDVDVFVVVKVLDQLVSVQKSSKFIGINLENQKSG